MNKLSVKFFLFPLVVFIAKCARLTHQTSSQHKQTHLVLLPAQLAALMESKLNSSGHVISSKGLIPEIIEWISLRFDFRYSYIPSTASLLIDDMPQKRGKISYLRNKEADGIVGGIFPSMSRFQDVDFPMPWMFTPFGIVIPFPVTVVDLQSVVKPWKPEVWIGLAISLTAIILSIHGFNWGLKKIDKDTGNEEKEEKKGRASFDFAHIIDYVICVLLSQGGYFYAKKLALRCAAAVWCLACLILVLSYSCVLTSVMTLPKIKPLVNSVYDIPKISELQVVAVRGMAVDAALSGADFGIFKDLRQSLITNPHLYCNSTKYCLEKVLTGPYVHIESINFIANAIREDHKKFGNCRFAQARDSFWVNPYSFALQKKSPYLESFNRGFGELWASGLIQKWTKTYSPDILECLVNPKKKPVRTRLTLNHFASAFLVLAVGYGLSLVAFVGERIHKRIVSM